jgi:transglutaminase-like putative cysteine protease
MYFTIRHTTRFRYSSPINESIMEVHMQPRSEDGQFCLDFRLHTSPPAQIMTYRDEFGNRVHHFDIPNSHSHLTITAESLVDLNPPAMVPQALDTSSWQELDTLTANDEFWETLMPSQYASSGPLLDELARELDVERRADPLTTLRWLNSALYDAFDWVPKATQVDSPIDEALRMRKGVCQDFAHIMITLVRQLRIPCRYVSGYLIQQGRGREQSERAERAASDAMHAWVEAYLPSKGWVGFDPTNDTLADERHVRVAVGRDYADVTPTRGIFRGKAETELAVTIRYAPSKTALTEDIPPELAWVAADHDGYDREQASQEVQAQPQQQ